MNEIILDNEIKTISVEVKDIFNDLYFEAKKIAEHAKDLVVTSCDQKKNMIDARAIRLRLKNIRVEVESKRKSLKEESLRTGKAIDGMANILKALIVPVEEHLQLQEDFAKTFEKRRRDVLEGQRRQEMSQFSADYVAFDVRGCDEKEYQRILKILKAEHAIYIDRQKIQEQERAEEAKRQELLAKKKIEDQKKLAKENEKLRAENEKIKKKEKIDREVRKKVQAIEAERLAKLEKEKNAAEEALNQKKREEYERNQEAQSIAKDLEIQRLRQERIDRLATDKDKLIKLVDELKTFYKKLNSDYELKNQENQCLVNEVLNSLKIKTDLINKRIDSF